MPQPLVSILMPYKNTANYLTACLESILAQSYTNWELISIDDHSTDGSFTLVREYAKKDARIKTYSNSGLGIIQALRMAYTYCLGKFITRMDSDDLMTPHRITYMVKNLVAKGNGYLSVGQVRYFSANGISDGYARYEKWLNDLTIKGNNFSEIYKECVVPSPCWMVYRSDFVACGAFDTDRYPEDYDLAFRFYEQGLKIIPCSQVLLLWRDYDSRTSRTSKHYAENYFLEIKLYYFLKLDYNTNSTLIIWGAGKKGKQIAQLLQKQNIVFTWACDNPKKIGKEIYGTVMQSFKVLEQVPNFQTIITVANENEQKIIRSYLTSLQKTTMKDYYFFC